jgi:hypothetical protein
LLVAASLRNGLTEGDPSLTVVLTAIGALFGFGLFIGNLLLAMFVKPCRWPHLTLACLLIAAAGLVQWTNGLHADRRRRAFVQEERKEYERIVQQVLQSRALLTDQPRRFEGVAPQSIVGFASTNSDGSMTVMFPGGEGGPRHGYLYHSGDWRGAAPTDPSGYLHHLTNGWYEY